MAFTQLPIDMHIETPVHPSRIEKQKKKKKKNKNEDKKRQGVSRSNLAKTQPKPKLVPTSG